jgi:tetratricopeptide (TPR) repeat protein
MVTTSAASRKDLIRLAAFRNCEGASHLADEEHEEAIADFLVALHCILQAIHIGGERGSSMVDDDDDDDDETDDLVPPESVDKYHFILDSPNVAWYAASKIQNSLTAAAVLSENNNNMRFVYDEALVFNPESANELSETPFFEGVIAFNLALTLHHKGLLSARYSTMPGNIACCDRGSLYRGLRCYNQSLESIRINDGPIDKANIMVEAHMLIACLNNKAQLLFTLGDYEHAYHILQELTMVMNAIAGNPPGFEEPEVRGLEGTMELLHSPEITASTPAIFADSQQASAASQPSQNSINRATPEGTAT